MNKRIRELAEQARHWAHFEGVEQNPTSSPDILFEEKFAELIVRECIEQIQSGLDTTEPDIYHNFYRGLETAKELIEYHFGVEE